MALTNCPNCSGVGATINKRTNQDVICPVCQGNGVVSAGYNDQDFIYPINPPALTSLQAGVTAQVAIDNDADFLCDRFVASSTGTYSVQLKDNFRAMLFSTANINGENIAGTIQNPFWLPNPFIIRKNAVISGSFTDRSGAGNTIQFCLVGRKLM